MIYDDFPSCLTRYAWLVAGSETNLALLFNEPSPHYCKACGEPVERAGWATHRRTHVRQLQQTARQRQRDQADRLRTITRLRAEARTAA